MRTVTPLLVLLWAVPATAADLPANYPMHPLEAEQRMRFDPIELLSAKRTTHGVAGAQKLRIRFTEDGKELTVKWKAAPRYKPEGWNNVPRKEVAAYQVQKWFLDAHEYVVPPTVTRCIPLDVFRKVDPDVEPTADSGTCVFGAMSLWIVDVEVVEKVVDRELFEADPVYARTLGDVNIVGYLIEHRDGRKSNFLISTLPGGRRVFSIDNGISFRAKMWNMLVPNMANIQVPALPRESIDRLRDLSFRDVARMEVLAQYERQGDVLARVPSDTNFAPDRGSRVVDGAFQFGLRRKEISGLWKRLGQLLADVNDGKIPLR